MRHVLILVLLISVLCGCGSASQSATTRQTDIPMNMLLGTWLLESMNGTSFGSRTVSLTFQDNQITGVGFCNSYSSTITVEGATLAVPVIVSTKKLCLDDDRMQREREYFAVLTTVESYVVDAQRLELRDAMQVPVLVYRR